jgi:GT2 family glycosyltransferase
VVEPSVTAVVVNYQSGGHLEICLDRLLEEEGVLAKVIVVDNDSGDRSAEPARRRRDSGDRVELVESSLNRGLAGGVNLALDLVDTPYMAILNPDVAVRHGWLGPLVDLMGSDPTVGAACPLVLMMGTQRVNSAGQTIHVSGLGFNRMLGSRFEAAARPKHEVGGLHGAAFLIRTDLLRTMGGWDETGFLYHEDVALSWDIHLSGFRIVCVPSSVVDHDYHLTMYPEKLHLLERNRWALLLSHLRPGRLVALSPILLVTELMVWVLCLVRGPRFLTAKARSYRWLWRQRDAIGEWRRRVFSRHIYDARRLRRSTVIWFPISQVAALGTERGPSRRVPRGGLPT